MSGFISEAMRKGRHLKGRWGVAKTGQVSNQGSVEMWEHWDGTVDANVRLRPFTIRISPQNANDPKVVALVGELEQAIRLNEAALRTGDAAVHRRTAAKVNEVKQRLVERLS